MTKRNKPNKPAPKHNSEHKGLPTLSEGIAMLSQTANTQTLAQQEQVEKLVESVAQQTAPVTPAPVTPAPDKTSPDCRKAAKIAPNKLGEFALRYNAAETEHREGYLGAIASSYGVTPAALLAAMKPFIDKPREVNKLQGKRGHFVKIQQAAFVACQYDNGLLSLDIAKTPAETLRTFMKGYADSKRTLADLLHSADFTPSATQGYGVFFHCPPYNLFTEETLDTPQFHLVSTGWSKGRSYPYYGVRMIPSKNRENTNRVQYAHPLPVTVEGKAVTVPDCYSEEFDSLYLKGVDSDDDDE